MKRKWILYESESYSDSKNKYTQKLSNNDRVEDLLDMEVSIENGEFDLKEMLISTAIKEMSSDLPRSAVNFMEGYDFKKKCYEYRKFNDKNLRVVFIINKLNTTIALIDVVNHELLKNERYLHHTLPHKIEKLLKNFLIICNN